MEDTRRPRVHPATARLKAQITAIEAFRRAAEHYEVLSEQSYGYASATSRQDSLIRCLSGTVSPQGASGAASFQKGQGTASGATPMPITAAEEAFSKRVAAVPRGTVRRGLLADPPPFTRTSRGVVVRGGGHEGRNQYAELKTAELRSAYALYLLETDLNHYRHLYLENERKQHVEGRLKFFSAPPCKALVPSLWLEEPWTAVENLPSGADDSIAAELKSLPALRQRFAVARKREIDQVQTKPRPQPSGASVSHTKEAPVGKQPASLLPGKGTVAALKVAAEKRVEAASLHPSLRPAKAKAAP